MWGGTARRYRLGRPAKTAAVITALLTGKAILAGMFAVPRSFLRNKHLAFDTGNRFERHGSHTPCGSAIRLTARPSGTVALAEALEDHLQWVDGQEAVQLQV